MKYLKAINNKCRCGKVAEGIVEEDGDKRRIVASNCKECGLKYVADDMRGYLTPSMQKLIKSIS